MNLFEHLSVSELRHTLCEGEVTFVCEGSVDKLGSIALVLVGVGELSIHHTEYTQP